MADERNESRGLPEKNRSEVFRMWARGGSVEGMAALFSISENEVREIVDEGIDRQPDLAEIDGERLVKEFTVRTGALTEEAAQAAVAGEPRDRIAASRLRLQALQWLFDLYQGVGVLPTDLGQFAVEIDLKRISNELWDHMHANGVDEEVIDGLIERLNPRRPTPDADGVHMADEDGFDDGWEQAA